MKPKTITDIIRLHDQTHAPKGEYEKLLADTVAQIQQLLEECAPELREPTLDSQTGAPVGMDGCIDYGYNQAIDQYKSNIREKLR